MTRVYGKGSHQKGRTTVKDPYLHYQNVPKQKSERPHAAPDTKGMGVDTKVKITNMCKSSFVTYIFQMEKTLLLVLFYYVVWA